MHVVCCIKQVPDTAEVRIDPETNTLVRAGVESISNPYDMVALEEGIRLKEKYGGMVTAICMGPPQGEASLREALSLGADDVVLLSDRAFAGADTLATSYTLSRAVDKLSQDRPVDLVLCGKQAIDGDTAQTGPGIATRLDYTQFTYVIEVDWIDLEHREIQVRRRVEGGIEVIRGALPALLTVELELARPRRAPLPALIQALRAPIKTWDAKALEVSSALVGIKGSPTWVRCISAPPARAGGPLLDARDNIPQTVAEAVDLMLADPLFASDLSSRWEG
jgi:electron transfer flavoprotein beta subunit